MLKPFSQYPSICEMFQHSREACSWTEKHIFLKSQEIYHIRVCLAPHSSTSLCDTVAETLSTSWQDDELPLGVCHLPWKTNEHN